MTMTVRFPLPLDHGVLAGHANGRIDRSRPGRSEVLQHYQFTGAAVRWLLATPDGTKLVAGHADGLVVVFDALSGKEISECSAQLQSEYRLEEALTWGELSPDGRWLWVAIRRDEVDIGLLIHLDQKMRPKRAVGGHGSCPGRPAQWGEQASNQFRQD